MNELRHMILREIRVIITHVTPAQADVQKNWHQLDSRLRGNDKGSAGYVV